MAKKSEYYLQSKYYLLEQPMAEARKLFSHCFFDGAYEYIAKDEEDRLDLFIQLDGKEFATTARDQLTQIIESHMSDDEIAEFIDTKLGSCDAAEPGESRDWLIEIRDYLRSKTNPLEQPMEEAEKLFTNYFFDGADKSIAKDQENRLDKFIKTYEKDFTIIAIKQLTQLIESHLSDDDLTKFIEHKLGASYAEKLGGSRQWLIEIRDYLEDKTT